MMMINSFLQWTKWWSIHLCIKKDGPSKLSGYILWGKRARKEVCSLVIEGYHYPCAIIIKIEWLIFLFGSWAQSFKCRIKEYWGDDKITEPVSNQGIIKVKTINYLTYSAGADWQALSAPGRIDPKIWIYVAEGILEEVRRLQHRIFENPSIYFRAFGRLKGTERHPRCTLNFIWTLQTI